MRFLRTAVVSKNMIRMALNSTPPVAWIQPRKINPLITRAVRTYADDPTWTCRRTVVRYEDIKKVMDKPDQYIVDLRDPNEVASTGMIPSSINIPASYLESALVMSSADFQRVYKRKKPTKKHDLIFYCQNGPVSAVASNKAVKLGFLRVKTYIGGWEDFDNQRRLDAQEQIKQEKVKSRKTLIKSKEQDDK